jgi:hypothetical protein
VAFVDGEVVDGDGFGFEPAADGAETRRQRDPVDAEFRCGFQDVVRR